MADQNNVTTQTIEINTDKAYQSIADLTRQLGDITKITAEAKEGISHVGEEYQFANAELQKWYDTLKQMDLAHNKTTTDIINDMQNAAAATKTAATATEEYGHKVAQASHGVTGALHTQKLAFEDIGRLALGEKLGLRQFAANFGLVGAAVSVAAFALYEYGPALLELIDPMTQAEEAQKALNATMAEASKTIAKNVEGVKDMQTEFEDADAGLVSRKQALDDYNEKFGKTLGIAQDYNEAEKKFAEKTAAYEDSMRHRAIADAARALAQKTLAEQIEKDVTKETSLWDKVKVAMAGSVRGAKSVADNTKSVLKDNHDAAQKTIDIYDALIKKENEAADANDKANGINTRGNTKHDHETKDHDNSLKEQQNYLDESQKLTENAEQKEITSEQIKYDKIRADLIAHHHSTEQLDEQHEQNVIDIHKKYADQLAAIFKKQADEAKLADDKLAEEFLKNAAKLEEEKKKAAEKDLAERKKDAAKFLTEEISDGALEIKQLKGHYDQKRALLESEKAQVKGFYADGLISREDYNKKIGEIDQAGLEIKKQQAEQEKMITNAAVSTLDSLAKIAGEKTQAGKDLAIASATIKAIQAGINTFEGFTSEFPGPVGIALGAIAAAGVAVTLFEEVKKIESVKIPGGSGGSSASTPSTGGGASVPGAPQIQQKSQSTNLSAATIDKLKPSTNQEPIRAVVVESDITNSQRRISSYQTGSSLH